MRALGRVAALCVPLLALEGAGAPSPAATPTKTHTITMENVGYTPAHLTVHRGDRIVWVNKESVPAYRHGDRQSVRLRQHRGFEVLDVRGAQGGNIYLHLQLSSHDERRNRGPVSHP